MNIEKCTLIKASPFLMMNKLLKLNIATLKRKEKKPTKIQELSPHIEVIILLELPLVMATGYTSTEPKPSWKGRTIKMICVIKVETPHFQKGTKYII